MNRRIGFLAAAGLLLLALPAGAGEWKVDEEESLLAVVTRKAGLAAGLAHDHLVAARGYTADLAFDPEAPEEASFELLVRVGELAVDEPALQDAWTPRLESLGILEEPFSEIKEKSRRKIREAMLGREQLDAERFPTLGARVLEVEAAAEERGGSTFPYRVRLALKVRGREAAAPMAARFELQEGRLVIEAFGTFLFTDLGIEPYSAALGAVRNADRFHAYLHLEARAAEP